MFENWITKNLNESLSEIILDFLDFFKEGVLKLFNTGTNFAKIPEVDGAVKALTLVALSLVVVLVLKELLTTYVFETNGDPDGDPMQLLVKASQAVALICCNDFIFDYIDNLSKKLMEDLKIASSPDAIFADTEQMFVNSISHGITIVNTIFVLVFLIFVVILALKAGLRAAELGLMKIIWSLFACDIITVSAERWNAFFTSYMVTFFGYIAQMLAFMLCINSYVKAVAAGGSSHEYLIAAAWMWFALNAPKWLEKFCYSSGLSKVAQGGMMGVMQIGYAANMLKR